VSKNSENEIQEISENEKYFEPKNIKQKVNNEKEIKMDIEVNTSTQSNNLIGSLSTQSSNNIYSSQDSKNLNNSKTNDIESSFEIQIKKNHQISETSNKKENDIFKFNFNTKDEYISFSGEYLNDIYSNLLKDEQVMQYKPKFGYMCIQTDINEQMRAILIDWLIEVHYRYRLKNRTLYQIVWIIDTYLSRHSIQRAELQLLGIASLLISCKSREIYYPQLSELIDITDGAYVKEELIKMEAHILQVLQYNIISPIPTDFYDIIAKSFNFDKKQYYLGEYFMESSLIDYQMVKYPPSVIAIASAYIVMKFFGINNYRSLYSNDVIKSSSPQKTIKDAAREICVLVKNLSQSSLKAIKDKYSLPQFLNVALFCEQK
jgi:cyclin B